MQITPCIGVCKMLFHVNRIEECMALNVTLSLSFDLSFLLAYYNLDYCLLKVCRIALGPFFQPCF